MPKLNILDFTKYGVIILIETLHVQMLYEWTIHWSLYINARTTYDFRIFLGSLFFKKGFKYTLLVLAQKIFQDYIKTAHSLYSMLTSLRPPYSSIVILIPACFLPLILWDFISSGVTFHSWRSLFKKPLHLMVATFSHFSVRPGPNNSMGFYCSSGWQSSPFWFRGL